MSRTTRKVHRCRWSTRTLTTVIEETIAEWNQYPFIRVKRRKSKKQYDEDFAKAVSRRNQLIAENGGSEMFRRWSWITGTVRDYPIAPARTSKSFYDKVPETKEEAIRKATLDYNSRYRDGKFSESGTNKGFKADCARTNRRANKNFCKKVIADEWEDISAPKYTDTSYKRWSWW